GSYQRLMPAAPLRYPLQEARPLGQNGLILQETLEVIRQFLGTVITLVRNLGDRLEDDCLQLPWHGLVQFPGLSWLFGSNLPQQFLPVLSLEGGFQRQEFVQAQAEGIDVSAVIHQAPFARRLFRAHVTERAQEVPAL